IIAILDSILKSRGIVAPFSAIINNTVIVIRLQHYPVCFKRLATHGFHPSAFHHPSKSDTISTQGFPPD
ncbi:hypothetical protein BGZ83_003175, partial [Gryganskiella cystojenkinii]